MPMSQNAVSSERGLCNIVQKTVVDTLTFKMLRLWINRSISYADKTRELSLSSVCPMLLIFEALLSDVSEWFNEFPEN